MVFTLTFLANAGFNFVLGLAVAGLLGPAEFGRYAMAGAVAVLVNAVFFYWLGFSAARFYSETVRTEKPAVRATLDRVLAILASLAVVAAVAVALLPSVGGLTGTLVGLGILAGLMQGLFDFACTLARARFLDRLYVRLVLIRTVGGFLLMLAAAQLWSDAGAVMAASIVAACIGVAAVRGALADGPLRETRIDPDLLRACLGYSIPLILSLVVYQAIPFLNRSLIAAVYGFEENGQFSLAYDTLSRIFFALGASFEFILFQMAVRAEERHGRAAAVEQLGRNVVIVLAVLLPAAAGFWLVLPAVAGTLVPPAFRDAFIAYSTLLLPAVVAQAAITSALNGVFQIDKRTAPAVAAAAAALAANLLLAAVLPAGLGPDRFVLAQVGGLLVALAVTAVMTLPVLRRAVPWRDLAVVSLGVMLMVAALGWWRGALSPLPTLLLAVPLGAALYAAVALAGDVAGTRRLLLERLGRRPA
ncbi:lipopolysaccharide biosynthesis protein [Alsobacter sp. R-9]